MKGLMGQETNKIDASACDKVLWIWNPAEAQHDKIEIVYSEYEDRDVNLMKAMSRPIPDLVKTAFPEFCESTDIARLIQEEDRSAGFKLRCLQVFRPRGATI